jgi:purine-nucleoside phosphorylase
MVNEHYANKKDGFWQEDLQHAQTDLATKMDFYVMKNANNEPIYPGIEASWGWMYASDEFYSKAQRNKKLVEHEGKEKAASSSSSGRGGRFAHLFNPV